MKWTGVKTDQELAGQQDIGNFFNTQTLLQKLWNALISDPPAWEILNFWKAGAPSHTAL